jgi:glutamate synthase (NADPH/NADH) small chain
MNSTGKTEVIEADLVFLALGFVHPVHKGLLEELGVKFDERGNVKADGLSMSNVSGVFATGDAVLGASLVVRAIASGRKVAEDIHKWLKHK